MGSKERRRSAPPQSPTSVPPPERRPAAWREIFWSSLIFAVVLGVLFGVPLAKSKGVYIHARVEEKPGQGLMGFAEHVYLTFPFYYLESRDLHAGKLPLWTPYSCAGTPLMGKQQTGIFSPLHIIFYLIPTRYFPYLWFLFYAASLYAGWIFMFLLARRYGVNFGGATAAALGFLLAPIVLGTLDECPGHAAVFVPALFFMVEELLSGERAVALLFLPWLFAIPFLIGHFEVGFFAAQAATAYYVAALWLYGKNDKVKKILEYGACALAGLAISCGQLAAGMQYVAHSFTKIWRSPGYFGWFVDRVPKPLGRGDAGEIAAVILSLAAATVCAWALGRRKTAPVREKSLWIMGALAALSVVAAGLLNLGMTGPLGFLLLVFAGTAPSWPYLAAGVVCAVLVFLALADAALPIGLRIFATLIVFSLLLHQRTPILSNLLYKLPIYDSIYLDRYCPELWIGLWLLAGWSISRLMEFPKAFARQRAAWVRRAGAGLALTAAAAVLGWRLASPLAGVLGQGINPTLWNSSENPSAGGISDAGHQFVYSRRRMVRGWLPESTPVRAVGMGLYRGSQTALSAAFVRRENGRVLFEQNLDLSPGDNVPVALIVAPDGSRRILRGSTISYTPIADASWLWPALIALAAALLFLAAAPWGGITVPCVALAALGFATVHLSRTDTSSPGNIAIPGALGKEWPFMNVLPHPAGLEPYRIYSPEQYNFPPAISTIHQISDLRNGDDTMDVFTTVRFLNLMQEFLAQKSSDLAARLLGVGNVKYVLSRPNAPLSIPGLSQVYSGPDMRVYRNQDFEPFARFYSRWIYLDGRGIETWQGSGQIVNSAAELIASKKLIVGRDLLLNDSPPEQAASAQSPRPDKPKVRILENENDKSVVSVVNNRPGFLFLSANDFPGWKAYVDGRQARILRAWITFRAVFLEPGEHRVDFVYDPRGVEAALLASALASFIWFLVWGETKFGRGRSRTDSRNGFFAAEVFLTVLIVADIFYWLSWCAWIYKGNVWFKAGARLAFAVALIFAARWLAMSLRKSEGQKAGPAL